MTDDIPTLLNKKEYRALVSTLDAALSMLRDQISPYVIDGQGKHNAPHELVAWADSDAYVKYYILDAFRQKLPTDLSGEQISILELQQHFSAALSEVKQLFATDPQIDAIMDSSEVYSHDRTPFLADADASECWQKLVADSIKKPRISLG